MKRIDLNVTGCMQIDGMIVIQGTQPNSTEEVEIVIPMEQIPAIVGTLEATEPKKKGGK